MEQGYKHLSGISWTYLGNYGNSKIQQFQAIIIPSGFCSEKLDKIGLYVNILISCAMAYLVISCTISDLKNFVQKVINYQPQLAKLKAINSWRVCYYYIATKTLEFGTKNPSHDSGLFDRYSRILLDPTALLQGTSQRARFQSPGHELHHKSYQPDQKGHMLFSQGWWVCVWGGGTKGTVPTKHAIPWSERVTSLKKTTCFSFSDMFIGSFQLVIVRNNFRMGINRLFLTSADWLLRLPRNGSVVSQQVKKVPLATGQWHLVAFRVGWCPALTAKLPVFWGCVFCRDG